MTAESRNRPFQATSPEVRPIEERARMSRPKVAFRGRHVTLPRSRGLRISLGIALVLGGLVGFLPILGFWMVPLGLFVLSFDFHAARRLRRRTIVRWERRQRAKRHKG